MKGGRNRNVEMQTEARVGVAVDGGVRKFVQPQPQQIGTISQLLAGGVAGALSKTCTAPLARLTILFQVPCFSFFKLV